MKRRHLWAFLRAASPALLLAMADDCAGAKVGGATGVSITGVSTTVNINAAAGAAAEGAAQGIDPAAGKGPVGTNYEGRAVVCRPIQGTDKVDCSSGGE